jgi:hypothetical protein
LAFLLATSFASVPAMAACGNDASGFDEWVAAFKKDAVAQGISQGTVNAALKGVTYDAKVIRADRNQKQFKQSFEQFSGRMIPPRVKRAKSMLSKHASTLSRIEKQYGVPAEVVVAIWGLETDFGAVKGNSSTLRSLATLAYDCRRGDFFTGQLIDALQIIERGDLSPAQMRGRPAWRTGADAVPAILLHLLCCGFRRQRPPRSPRQPDGRARVYRQLPEGLRLADRSAVDGGIGEFSGDQGLEQIAGLFQDGRRVRAPACGGLGTWPPERQKDGIGQPRPMPATMLGSGAAFPP